MWRFPTDTQAWRIILAVFFVFLLIIGARYVEAEEVRYGYNDSPLNVREEMDVDSKWVEQYPSKSTIIILEDLGEWYRVENGFIKSEYVFDSIEIYRRGKVLYDGPIYAEPNADCTEVFGSVTKDSEDVFIRKVNGYLELLTGGFIPEEFVTFDFVAKVEIHDSVFSISDMESWNMVNLPIQYLGTLFERTPGDSVTSKSKLYFVGDIPIYDIIDGYAYFPSGRNIFKISLDKFLEIKNVGASYEVLAAYRTVYYSSSKARKHNIALAASYLDGTVIQSGKTFSYNKTTGPRDASKGYEMADVISNGEYVLDYGGGVCQVSSTIYAAIMNQEDFQVTARKPHGLEVLYLPLEMDATVSYGSVDLKFVNEKPFSVKLNVKTEDNGICLVTLTRAD